MSCCASGRKPAAAPATAGTSTTAAPTQPEVLPDQPESDATGCGTDARPVVAAGAITAAIPLRRAQQHGAAAAVTVVNGPDAPAPHPDMVPPDWRHILPAVGSTRLQRLATASVAKEPDKSGEPNPEVVEPEPEPE
eukprot:SAG22_NODE_5783_length_953_cov_1.067916_2_plen_135_part_01